MCRLLALALLASVVLTGCGSTLLQPDEMTPPAPIEGTSGKFISPYTSDGVVAEWVEKGKRAARGAAIGTAVGIAAGAEALGPLGSLLGRAGRAAGRRAAISSFGGFDFIRETSDLSFDNPNDLAVYLYAVHSNHEDYEAALLATRQIYPKLNKKYEKAVQKASKKQKKQRRNR